MSDLHWTGAALLLAVAVLGPAATPRREPSVSWPDVARGPDLHDEELRPHSRPRAAVAGHAAVLRLAS